MDILDRLTPELNPSQVSELKRRLREAEKSLAVNKCQYDPRIVNLPLPNDAKITYKYGARAYESDLYKGFVWRNGVWYVIDDNLRFDKPDIKNSSIANYNYGTIYSNINTSLIGVNIDDTFYPCILNGQRIFIHENWENNSPFNTFIYEPTSHQIFVNTMSMCRRVYNGKQKIYYEDEANMCGIPK